MQEIKKWAAANGIDISCLQLEKLIVHQQMVLEKNRLMNLTAITDPVEFEVKHIIDSLTLLPYIQGAKTLADIGSGAGFPGVVLAIMRPDMRVTLIDSLRKRVFFLQEVAERLELTNIEAVHSRAEDRRQGDKFDICTARAVASMDKLAKWILPLVKPGGTFLAMKGPDVTDELDKAKPAIARHGGWVKAVDRVEIGKGIVHSVVAIDAKYSKRIFHS